MSNCQPDEIMQASERIRSEEKRIQYEEIKIKKAEKRLKDTIQEIDQTIKQAKKRRCEEIQKESESKQAAQKTISEAMLTLKAFKALVEQEGQQKKFDAEGNGVNPELNQQSVDTEPAVSPQSRPVALDSNQVDDSKNLPTAVKIRRPITQRPLCKPYGTRKVPAHMVGPRVHWSELILERRKKLFWLACCYCGINAVFYKSKDPKHLELLKGAWGLKVHLSKKHRAELKSKGIVVEDGNDNKNRETVERYILDECELEALTEEEAVAYRIYKQEGRDTGNPLRTLTISEDCWSRSGGVRMQTQESDEMFTPDSSQIPSLSIKSERIEIDLTEVPSSAEIQSSLD